MKYLFSVFFTTGFFCAFAQPADVVQFLAEIKMDEKISWVEIEKKHSFAETYRIVNEPNFNCDCYKWVRLDSLNAERILHWIDLNGDQKDDLIFSGGCMPYTATCIFLNTDGKMKNVWSSGGYITKLEVGSSSTKINTFSEACCCSAYSSCSFLTIDQNADSISQEKDIGWYGQMPLAEHQFSKTIETDQVINLRYAPKVNNKIIPWECNDESNVNGNIVASFKKGTPVTCVAKKRTGGRTWYFVIVPPNETRMEEDYENQPFEHGKTYSMGWVTAQELNLSKR